MGVQTIVTPSGEKLVVLAASEYEALVEAAEDAEDIAAFIKFQQDLKEGREELVPAELVNRIRRGENRVKVWREYRGLTAQALAEKAGIAQGFLSQIETGKRDGTVDTLLKIASELRVQVEDLVEQKNVRIERLIHQQPGLTVAELAQHANASESHARKVCDWLRTEGRAVVEGHPARFFPPAESDI